MCRWCSTSPNRQAAEAAHSWSKPTTAATCTDPHAIPNGRPINRPPHTAMRKPATRQGPQRRHARGNRGRDCGGSTPPYACADTTQLHSAIASPCDCPCHVPALKTLQREQPAKLQYSLSAGCRPDQRCMCVCSRRRRLQVRFIVATRGRARRRRRSSPHSATNSAALLQHLPAQSPILLMPTL